MGDHPVRRPHAPAAHGPSPLQDLEGLEHPEAAQLAQAVEEPLHLADVGAVGENDPARTQGRLRRRRSLPWLRQVEQHPVHVSLVHALVDVAQLQRQVGRQGTKALHDPSPGRLQKLLPGLVADHRPLRPDGAEGGEGQGAGTGPGLDHLRPRVHVRGDQDRSEVLGVDRLGLAAPAGDLLGERRSHGEQSRPHLGRDHHALRTADQVVVVDKPRVDRVTLACAQPDPVPASHLVDEEDDLAFGEGLHRAGRAQRAFMACGRGSARASRRGTAGRRDARGAAGRRPRRSPTR